MGKGNRKNGEGSRGILLVFAVLVFSLLNVGSVFAGAYASVGDVFGDFRFVSDKHYYSFWNQHGDNTSIFYDGSKVGIGIATPGEALDVLGRINASTDICISGGNCLSDAGVGGADITGVGSMLSGNVFSDSGADDDWIGLGAIAGRIEFDDQATDEINFLNASVGIGTASPNAKLHVQNGNFQVNGSGSARGLFYNSTSGNLGIGIVTPGRSLEVSKNGVADKGIRISYWDAPTSYYVELIQSFIGNGLGFRYNFNVRDIDTGYNGTAMSIQPTGNVGIGTTSPNGTLDVTGHTLLYQAGDEGANRTAPSDDDPHLRVYSSDETQANDYIEMYHDQASGNIFSGGDSIILRSTAFDFKGSGNNYGKFTIGSNVADSTIIFIPDAGFDEALLTLADGVGNQLVISNYANRDRDHDHAVQTDPTLYIHSDTDPDTDNTEWLSMAYIGASDYARVETGKGDLALMPAGNVGIGTASPIGKLNVIGDANVTGAMIISSMNITVEGNGDVNVW